jgi:adenine-specific DNA-methyltransferase
MSLKFDRLVSLLRELFQLDQPDLDFGLYRIMHAKAGEVTQFLEKDLLPQVRRAFEQYQPADKAAVQKRLAEAIAAAESLGVDPTTNPKVAAIKAELAAAVDLSALEDEVFDHLHSFFRRYYSEGDFLSKRVYKPGVYAVPYEGEEVILHWANKDQYYIKTSEYLRDYAFRLKPDSDTNPMRVHFRLAEVAEGEHGNIKAAEGKDRVFILAPAGESGRDFIEIEKVNGQDELVIKFAYRPAMMEDWAEGLARSATEAAAKKPPTQKVLSDLAIKAILAVREPALASWITELSKPHVKVGGEQAEYSRMQGHLSRYTARHTFDYFIHKDLGGFLRRELDFYIKNEVMHLDDIESESVPKVEQYLSKIKIIRVIAAKVIAFVAQIEDFQKKLWLKKKLIIATDYCITLDRVPRQLFGTIALNKQQREQWEQWLGIKELPGYSSPLTSAFLEANLGLPLCTAHFDTAFREAIEHSLTSQVDSVRGLLVHGDNFHALRLLAGGLAEAVRCIYIDPPYNTDVSAIPYKNNYKHSSFASLIHDRTALMLPLLSKDGVLFVSIDKNERSVVEYALDSAFGRHNRVEELIWVQNTNDGRSPTYSTNHEYVEVYAKDRPTTEAIPRIFREPKPGYAEVAELIQELNPQYPSITEIESALRDLYRAKRQEYRKTVEGAELLWEEEKTNDPWNGIYQYHDAEYRDVEGRLVLEAEAKSKQARIWVFREDNWTIMSSEIKQSETTRDPQHPNYRYYQPIHPVTKNPCRMSTRGWKGTQFVDPKHPDRNSFESLVKDHRIVFGPDENKVPQQKRFLHEVETNVCKSVFNDYSDGEKELAELFGRKGIFLAPKHTNFVRRFLRQCVDKSSLVLDCFGGSGSTGHAVIRTNREEQLNLKFVLVEVNTYFDTVLFPRIVKCSYASRWDTGQPVEKSGDSFCYKIIRLESYEDSLNNLLLQRSPEQESLLARPEAKALAEQYRLRYMLDTETRGSPSLLNIRQFTDPTAYTMRIKRPGTDESVVTAVDLIETFNWLIGLTVNHFAAPQTFTSAFERDSEGRLRLKGAGARGGRLKPDANSKWWFRTLTGKAPDGKRVLVIWRKRPGGDTPEGIEQDNLVLDEWFRKQGYSTSDAEFDLIYVNGDNNLGNLRQEEADEKGLTEAGWKVRVIEEDFHRLMFDTEGA